MSAVDLTIQDIIATANKLPAKEKTTIRFFERQKNATFDRFIVVGEDAMFMANEVRGSKHTLKGGDEDMDEDGGGDKNCGTVYLPVSMVQFEAEVRDLLLSYRYKVQMYIKCGNKWIMEYEATPGNLGPLEDMLYSSSDHLNSRGLLVVSVTKAEVTTIGTAYIDLTGLTIDLCHFEDDANYSNFESLLVMLAPRECLVSRTKIDEKLLEKLNFNRISVTFDTFDKRFDTEIIENCVKTLTTREKYGKVALAMMNDIPEPSKQLVTESLFAAISYLNLMGDSSKHHQFEVREVKPRLFMRLDMTAVSSLNLFTDTDDVRIGFEGNKGDRKTVFSFLNRCRTFPGQRLLSQWIRQPLIDRNSIETEIRNVVYDDKLRKVPDLVKLSKKFASRTASLADMYQAYIFIKTIPSLAETIGEDNMFARINFTDKLNEYFGKLELFMELVEKTIDITYYNKEREFRIRPDFDAELSDIGQEIDALEKAAERAVQRARRQLDFDDISLNNENNNFNYSVSNKKEKLVRGDDTFEIISTKMNGVKFVDSTLTGINEKYGLKKELFEIKQKDAISEIRDVVESYYDCIKELGDLISTIDVIVSMAVSAVSSKKYVRPEILQKGSGKLVLEQVRHPCLEAQGIDYIPNDVELSDEKHKFLLITGPNMGGKSTYIRSIGIAVLMAQVGSYVAADSAVISVVDGIYTRIGAADQQMQGNSTFMTEMIETAAILRSATENSLVIIDELGRGTSTFDGFGLAWAISRHIALEMKSFTLFATHYHGLTKLSEEVASVGNVHVSAFTSDTEVCMMYKVEDGVCDQSYGIHVAKLAGFPDDMIQKAESKLKLLDGDLAKGYDLKSIKNAIKNFDVDSATPEEIISFVNSLKSEQFKLN